MSDDLMWWITVVDVPALAGLLILIWRTREDTQDAVDEMQLVLDRRCEQLRDALAGFKLEVAKNYASRKDLRDVESRIVEHLLRIEAKLDETAMRTATLTR